MTQPTRPLGLRLMLPLPDKISTVLYDTHDNSILAQNERFAAGSFSKKEIFPGTWPSH
jgi:hypothetical protein